MYGLFAAADIIHPDGKTGTVYMANDLVAVTTTDKNGDASFMTFTEAPGMIYDYEEGKIVDHGQGWNADISHKISMIMQKHTMSIRQTQMW